MANNADLDEFQKFYSLKSSLEGEALRAVESISISGGSYTSAFNILINRYNNTRFIVQDHIQAILNATHISKSSHAQLRQLLDTTTNNLESLKNWSCRRLSGAAILVQIIISKLDCITRREYELVIDKEIPKLAECPRSVD